MKKYQRDLKNKKGRCNILFSQTNCEEIFIASSHKTDDNVIYKF